MTLLLGACAGRAADGAGELVPVPAERGSRPIGDDPSLSGGSAAAPGQRAYGGEGSGAEATLPALPSCGNGVLDGDEAAVDCGGACGACAEPCGCAASDALTPLGCAEARELVGTSGNSLLARLDALGTVVAFDACDNAGVCHPFVFRTGAGVQALPMPPSGGSVIGMSGDGQTLLVVPWSDDGEPLVVDAAGSSTHTGLYGSQAVISAAGVVAGLSAPKPNGHVDLLRWTRSEGTESLGELTFAPSAGAIEIGGISADGNSIAGTDYGTAHAFKWVAGHGLDVDLDGELPDGAMGMSLKSVSRDGSTFAGITTTPSGRPDSVVRWSAAEGLRVLDPAMESSAPWGAAYTMALSADGGVLAMSLKQGTGNFGAFRSAGTEAPVPLLPDSQSVVYLMSSDGSVIIGHDFETANPESAFMWDARHGARDVRAALESSGVDFHGWELHRPTAISDDGRVLVGTGRCGGVPTAYRLALPSPRG